MATAPAAETLSESMEPCRGIRASTSHRWREQGREPSSLGADHERDRPVSELEVEHRLRPALVQTDSPDPETFEFLEGSRYSGDNGDADVLDRARGDFCHRRGDMGAAVARQHDPGHPRALGTAQEGTQVLRIGDAVHDDEERHLPGPVSRSCPHRARPLRRYLGLPVPGFEVGRLLRQRPVGGHGLSRLAVDRNSVGTGELLERRGVSDNWPELIGTQAHQVGQVGFRQRLGKGDHTLWGLRALDLLDLALADEPHRDMARSRERLDLAQDRGRIRTLHHPNLVDRPPVGGEELSDRLPPLDLIAAQLAADLCRAAPAGRFRQAPSSPEWLAGTARTPSNR